MLWLKNRRVSCARALLVGFLLTACAQADTLNDVDSYRPLTADRKALRVGDNLTVLVVETAKAEASTGRATDRRTDVSAEMSLSNRAESAAVAVSGAQDNSGGMQRSGTVRASITATVVGVDDGGRLAILGQQEIYIDGEMQSIRVEGKVRPVDISHDNIVLSTRLADSRIEYIGDGDLSKASKSNWFQRLMTTIGLM